MRDIILAVYLERNYQNDLVAYRQHFSRRQWFRSLDGITALNKFDRIWPTFWVLEHPEAA